MQLHFCVSLLPKTCLSEQDLCTNKGLDAAMRGGRGQVQRELWGMLWRIMMMAGANSRWAVRKYKGNFSFIKSCCSALTAQQLLWGQSP